MDQFPTGRNERDKLLKKNASFVDSFKDIGVQEIIERRRYTWLDSHLDSGDSNYRNSFYNTFKDVIPTTEISLKHYIESCLEHKKGHAVGVEFGGIGVNAFKDFSKNFFEQSVGITLVDHRDKLNYKHDGRRLEQIEENNHTILLGDILSPQTYDELNVLLHGKKIDLIIERMAGGLEFIPAEPYYISKILQIWYRMLDENGLMLVQVPVQFNYVLDKWAKLLDEDVREGCLNFSYSKGFENHRIDSSTFRLQKLVGAPIDLPMLDPYDLRSTKKFIGND